MLDVEKQLINKGITEQFLSNIKKKKVIFINSKFYIENDVKENVIIDTTKIMSTQRTEYDGQTWWDNIFDLRFSNVSQYKWERIKSKFEDCTLREFREWFTSDEFPPIELAYYYRDLDLYEVREGHHRTSWAILVGAPFIMVQKLYIWERRSDLVEFYKKIMKKKKLLKKIARKLNLSISSCNEYFNYRLFCDERIHFKDYIFCEIPKIDQYNLKNEEIGNKIIQHLDECIQSLNEIKLLHEDLKNLKLPKCVKNYILLMKLKKGKIEI